MKTRHRTVIAVILLFLTSCGSASRRMIYHPVRSRDINTSLLPGSEIISYSKEGRTANGLIYKGGSHLAVIFHTSYGTVESEIECAERYIGFGYTVLIPEYPGYGISGEYRSNENDIYEDTDLLIRSVMRENGYKPADTVLYGRSLGAAVAIEMARRNLGKKLVCISPFTSMAEIISSKGLPGFIDQNFNDQEYANLPKAFDIYCPVLIVSARHDKKVPFSMAEKLNEVFPESTLIAIDSGKHEDIYDDFTEEIWDIILHF